MFEENCRWGSWSTVAPDPRKFEGALPGTERRPRKCEAGRRVCNSFGWSAVCVASRPCVSAFRILPCRTFPWRRSWCAARSLARGAAPLPTAAGARAAEEPGREGDRGPAARPRVAAGQAALRGRAQRPAPAATRRPAAEATLRAGARVRAASPVPAASDPGATKPSEASGERAAAPRAAPWPAAVPRRPAALVAGAAGPAPVDRRVVRHMEPAAPARAVAPRPLLPCWPSFRIGA